MTRRVLEKLCTKKVCVDFLAPTKGTIQILLRAEKIHRGGPKGVSTKGVSMKRPNFPLILGHFIQ